MKNTYAKELIEKYQSGEATPEELAVIERWIMLGVVQEVDLSDAELQADLKEIRSRLPLSESRKVTRLWLKVAMAAAGISAIVFGVYLLNPSDRTPGPYTGNYLENDIAPGRSGATIKLGNGNVVALNGAKQGVIISQDLKYTDGSLVEHADGIPDPGTSGNREYQFTASTSRGQTYQFTLPDGTKVWLNADSKLEFAANFGTGKSRNVKIRGEAYFEVKHNAAQPFRVISDVQTVEDIGTAFNINAYADEPGVKTTLVEGSARVFTPASVNSPGKSIVLEPQQQAQVINYKIGVKQVDVQEATDWKNGYFKFDNESIESVMKKLSRWYDIEVHYQHGTTDEQYNGRISRNKNISQVLKLIGADGSVRFKVEGRRVTVMQ